MDKFKHPRISQTGWRFPLYGLLCVLLSLTIVAWGTAYKLSLYTTTKDGAPAKVCTRGSDAAKSGVTAAIDGRKIVGTGLIPSLPVNFRLALPERGDVVLPDASQIIPSQQPTPIQAARPPPVRFLFS